MASSGALKVNAICGDLECEEGQQLSRTARHLGPGLG
jgi:hypothetical protein